MSKTSAVNPFARLDREERVRLVSEPGIPEQVHVFDDNSRLAVKSALAAGRPLLMRGEPGVGKTQLAAATAAVLGRAPVSCVVNARTESTDLLWSFDSVRRLAEGLTHLPDLRLKARNPLWPRSTRSTSIRPPGRVRSATATQALWQAVMRENPSFATRS